MPLAHTGLIPRLAWWPVVIYLCATVGCGSQLAREAPFPVRPDSVTPGELTGEFTGTVRDAESKQAVASALVYATWTFRSGYGSQQPAGSVEYVTATDANGSYRIPRLSDVPIKNRAKPDSNSRLHAFHLIIYKRGYIGYRSDRRYEDFSQRHDFAQQGNKIRLQRWRDEYSHARHVRYMGGGPAITSLITWEVDAAVAELNGDKRVATRLFGSISRTRITASQLITIDELIKITGYDGKFETGPLGDSPDTAVYSSQHFQALQRPESFSVWIRLFQLSKQDARERYGRILDQSALGSKPHETNAIASRSFYTLDRDFWGTTFLDLQRGMVVMIGCGRQQCESETDLEKIANLVYDKIQQLVPTSAGPLPGVTP